MENIPLLYMWQTTSVKIPLKNKIVQNSSSATITSGENTYSFTKPQ